MEKMLLGGSNIWEDMVMYGGETKNGASISYFEINMVDKNVNSLKQLNGYFNSIAKGYKNSMESDDMRFRGMDTTVAPPPPPPAEVKPAN
jgi:hypothetical protein